MKHIKNTYTTLFFILFFSLLAQAQILKPVKWSYKINQLTNNEYEIALTAGIDKEWHIFALENHATGYGLPTEFTFAPNANYSLVGKVTQPTPITHVDKDLNSTDFYFENNVTFKQKIAIKNEQPFDIKVDIAAQACKDYCIQVPDNLVLKIVPIVTTKTAIPLPASTDPVAPIKKKDSTQTQENTKNEVESLVIATEKDSLTQLTNNKQETKKTALQPITPKTNKSYWGIFLECFLGGLLALLMPCTYPMIPMTVAFFLKRNKQNKTKAISEVVFYGLSIVFIFVLLGTLLTSLLGANAAYTLSTNAFVNFILFAIFLALAFSFFGAFEIVLPNSVINKVDSASHKGGYIGIFFMAFTLVLISFSCTVGVLSPLLIDAAAGKLMGAVIGMTGFGLAWAIPFTLFALFPSWLKSMPKSGGWLNTLKICFGFIELAFALKFLSNIDLAGITIEWANIYTESRMGFLKREIFIALWIAIFGTMALYLLGKIKFTSDEDAPTKLSATRLLFSILTIGFVFYLLPGMWGAPLQLLSGLVPLQEYNEGWNSAANNSATASSTNGGENMHTGPYGLATYLDYTTALEAANKQGKPLFIDFTGHTCANCRKMEENVWGDKKVLDILKNKYVIASLYCDEGKKLPAEEVSPYTGTTLKTYGQKWLDFQIGAFNSNAQPYYILVDGTGTELARYGGYNSDVQKFIDFLNIGLK